MDTQLYLKEMAHDHLVWGWLTVVCLGALVLSIRFRVRIGRKSGVAAVILSILLSLFFFLQWIEYWE